MPYPSRSDRFNGVTGSPGGLRGEIEISPGPLAKKGYNVALGSMFVLTPSENSLTANFQLPLRGSLLVYFINSCDKPPSPREEDFNSLSLAYGSPTASARETFGVLYKFTD